MTARGKDDFQVLPSAPLADVQRARAGGAPGHRDGALHGGRAAGTVPKGWDIDPTGIARARKGHGATGAPKHPVSISKSQGHPGRARLRLTQRLGAEDEKKSCLRY